jgi:hypothetical protein
MSIYDDVREARERAAAAENALCESSQTPPSQGVQRALTELRKAINVLDEWID